MLSSEKGSSFDLAMGKLDSRKSMIIANKIDIELDRGETENSLYSMKDSCICCNTRVSAPGREFAGSILIMLPVCLVFIPVIFISIAFVYSQFNGTFMLPPTRNIPYISDIGNHQPQSSFFTVGLVISSFCTMAVVFARYIQVQTYVQIASPWINRSGLVFGILIATGKLIVATFQLTGFRSVHCAGALLYAFSTVIFTPIQTYISHKDETFNGTYKASFLAVRGFLSAGIWLGCLIFGLFLIPDLGKFNRPGYSVAQAGEWFFAVCKMAFMLTFIVDFWKFQPRFSLDKIE